ncbi:MAG: dihydrodipicolinate synthase family protein, partial [Kangiellaceae bacterium]|nr:dihydrodipicolinate synthase family protein [Kangiellaceae bacterium]
IGPAIIYNVEARTGQDISPQIMQNIADNQNFIGVKECAGNPRISEYETRGIACWSGNDDESFNGRHSYNSHGVISVTSNIVPGLMRKLMDENDHHLNDRLQSLIGWLFKQPNPIGISTALAMSGAIKPVFRLPYLPLNKQDREDGVEILKEFDNDDLVGNSLSVMDDEQFAINV